MIRSPGDPSGPILPLGEIPSSPSRESQPSVQLEKLALFIGSELIRIEAEFTDFLAAGPRGFEGCFVLQGVSFSTIEAP